MKEELENTEIEAFPFNTAATRVEAVSKLPNSMSFILEGAGGSNREFFVKNEDGVIWRFSKLEPGDSFNKDGELRYKVSSVDLAPETMVRRVLLDNFEGPYNQGTLFPYFKAGSSFEDTDKTEE